MIRAGALRHRVNVRREKPPAVYATRGRLQSNPETVATAWAEIVPLRGSEAFFSRQLSEIVTHQVTLRYNADIAAIESSWWLEWSTNSFTGRRLNIGAVRNVDERNKVIELLCGETRTT